MSLTDIVNAIQEQIAELALEGANYSKNKAMFEAATASNYYEKSKLALKNEEIMLRRASNANRPSILLGAMLTKEERNDKVIFIAEARGMTAEGNTPENAFLNFDDCWVGKNEEN